MRVILDPFSYLAPFIAIIPAIALAYIFGGLADLVQHQVTPRAGRVRWSVLYLAWTVILVLSIAYEWFVLCGGGQHGDFNFWFVSFLLVKPSLLLFMARLLIPTLERGTDVDLEAQYFQVYRWIVPLYAAWVLLDIPDTLLHTLEGINSFQKYGGVRYVAVVVSLCSILLLAPLLSRNRTWHRIFAVA